MEAKTYTILYDSQIKLSLEEPPVRPRFEPIARFDRRTGLELYIPVDFHRLYALGAHQHVHCAVCIRRNNRLTAA